MVYKLDRSGYREEISYVYRSRPLTASAFAHHDPMTLRGPHRTMDQGEQRFSLLLQAAPDLSRGDA